MKIGIIPARYGSTRLPAKALADIAGKPMFWYVYNQAIQSGLDKVYLATDDERIKQVADELLVPVIMTSTHHLSGSDRVKEAVDILYTQFQEENKTTPNINNTVSDDTIIINIQGDEPLLKPQMLDSLLDAFKKNTDMQVATLAKKLNKVYDKERLCSSNTVKVVFDNTQKALYFSRSLIPYSRDEENTSGCERDDCFLHIGIYAFRYDTLKKFTSLEASKLEQTEKLEQLRLLENGIPIHIVLTEFESTGVDTLEDLENVRKKLQS